MLICSFAASALLFSATFKKRIEKLARDVLTDPVRVVQGDIGEANEDVQQIVKLMPPGGAKFEWLINCLVELTSGMFQILCSVC